MQLNQLFIDEINGILPSDEAKAMLDAIASSSPTTAVRFNEAKGFKALTAMQSVPWCQSGIYLPERPQFTFDPMFHAGCYYVQDPSSMFIAHIIKSLINRPVKYLDLCAAPGGKTTAALQALPKGSIMISNEIMPQRAQILRENVIKWGADNCMVTCDNPKSIGTLVHEFDVIAADVPCSGEGMFRKDDDAVAQWSPVLVEQCAARQRAILQDIWPALKPGGLIIYSTCTYNTHENEEIVDFIINTLKATPISLSISDSWNIHPAISRNYPGYRFLPHLTKGEGLFMCVLQKDTDNTTDICADKPQKTKKANTSIPNEMLNWIEGDYSLDANNEVINAVPNYIKVAVKDKYNKLHIIKHFGVELGTIKGKKAIPSHQLAMSPNINPTSFPMVGVDYKTAINYLRGQAIIIDAPRGYVLLNYNGSTLGFVNNLGNRANNLYPKPWRIISSHTPDVAPQVVKHYK